VNFPNPFQVLMSGIKNATSKNVLKAEKEAVGINCERRQVPAPGMVKRPPPAASKPGAMNGLLAPGSLVN
jgi:hypothetical protein